MATQKRNHPLLPLVVYVKQSYSLPGPGIQCASSCQSLATVIDFNNNPDQSAEEAGGEVAQRRPPNPPLAACPVAHEVLILVSLKQALYGVPVDVKLVNPNKSLPHELRRRQISQLPAILDPNTGEAREYRMDLVDYLQRQYPTAQLSAPEPDRDSTWQLLSAIHTVNTRFYHFVRQHYAARSVAADPKRLVKALGAMDRLLARFATQWQADKHYPSTLGCHLMPRLHHIRVVLEQLADESIPGQFRQVWHYLQQTYLFEPFRQWCPSDQEIILHWMIKSNYRQVDPRSYRRQMMGLIRLPPSYSFHICTDDDGQTTRL